MQSLYLDVFIVVRFLDDLVDIRRRVIAPRRELSARAQGLICYSHGPDSLVGNKQIHQVRLDIVVKRIRDFNLV